MERCQHTGPKVHTLVTLGGQHQGVMNVPSCWNPSFNMTPSMMCTVSQRFLGWGATLPFIRTHLVQAQYFKVCAIPAEQTICQRIEAFHPQNIAGLNTFMAGLCVTAPPEMCMLSCQAHVCMHLIRLSCAVCPS